MYSQLEGPGKVRGLTRVSEGAGKGGRTEDRAWQVCYDALNTMHNDDVNEVLMYPVVSLK